jgi:hypothetical protein
MIKVSRSHWNNKLFYVMNVENNNFLRTDGTWRHLERGYLRIEQNPEFYFNSRRWAISVLKKLIPDVKFRDFAK